jgi:hypothetical protein
VMVGVIGRLRAIACRCRECVMTTIYSWSGVRF